MKRIFTLLAFVAMILPSMAQNVTVTSSRFVAQGGTMTVHYEGAPVGTDAWLGLYKSSSHKSPKRSVDWAYTVTESGDYTFTLNDWDAYFVVLFKDGNYDEIARSEYVLACNDYNAVQAAEFQMTTDKEVYKIGEPVVVNYTGAPNFGKDWIAIYKAENYPGLVGNSESYLYVEGNSGTMTLNVEDCLNYSASLEEGNYYVTYCLWDGYAEVFQRVPFTVVNTTGINATNAQTGEVAIFNLVGQRLTKVQKGLNIIDGKKILK